MGAFRLLSGKKTIVGSLLLSVLSLLYLLDTLIHGSPAWFTEDQYIAFGGIVGGLTGVAMRSAIAKGEGSAVVEAMKKDVTGFDSAGKASVDGTGIGDGK